MSSALEPHFFRHEYGRLVAMLSRRVGVQHLESVEDAVQAALLSAVEAWSRDAMPDNPSAWLFRVAHNSFLSLVSDVHRGLSLISRGERHPSRAA
jgi:RNA polymerase sigma-70 factor (ECF subfamily)